MKKEFYINKRKNYLDLISDNSVTILTSGANFRASADNNFEFEVDKNFYYLTGINQAEVMLVISKIKGVVCEYLFIEENDPVKVKWVGFKLEKEEADAISGITNIFYCSEFEKEMQVIMNDDIKTVYLNMDSSKTHRYNHNDAFSKALQKKLARKYVDLSFINNCPIIVSLRFVKSSEEVEKIQESIEITKIGIEKLMSECRPGLYEYQLESHFDFVIKNHVNRGTSFKTIAASGANATILHYEKNNSILVDGDLILFDLGTRTEFYISDISRTFPVNGKFTPRQKQVYEEVLNVNKECIKFLKPGLTRIEFNNYAKNLLTKACYRLGLIDKDEDVIKYYYHSIGHSIGLDTHDPADYSSGIKAGSVMTVEPGLYIEQEGIGVRIEDNILVCQDHNVNLSEGIIKDVADIEAFFALNNRYQK